MLKRVVYLFLCLLYAFTQATIWMHLLTLPYWQLLVDGAIQAVLFFALAWVLQSVTMYGNFAALTIYQRLINYTAIGVLIVGIWIAAGYGIFYLIFGENDSTFILNTLWVKGFIGTLMYSILVQFFHYQQITEDKEIQTEETFVQKMEENIDSKQSESNLIERIAVKTGQKIHVVLVPEIIYIQAEGDYVKIHTEKGKFLKEETMKYFQEHLPSKQFVRVHRSYIVNVEMIHRIEMYEK